MVLASLEACVLQAVAMLGAWLGVKTTIPLEHALPGLSSLQALV